nr:MAG TPA: terminase [Caudoviricetes sp.]DAR87386.1 MAG TPA: terminase [Caudoviricetes sp.]DAU58300.1 MAG TPA: terminase [Caudoviricetes sp.]
MKKLINRSPDFADAIAMRLWFEVSKLKNKILFIKRK